MKHYTFVDYATQGYVVLTGTLVLIFHNQTVPHWPGLLMVHGGILLAVHGLIRLAAISDSSSSFRAGGRNPAGLVRKLLDLIRHFYPVLLYAWFYAETGLLNRMFVPDYLDRTVIGWEQALFGCQPSIVFMSKLPYLAVSEVFYAAYFSYYLMIGGVGLALFLRNRAEFFHYLSVLSFLFYVCYLLYIALPVIGPPGFFRQIEGYTFPRDIPGLPTNISYPESVQNGLFFRLMAGIYRVFEAPGAALPSSHVAVALCTVYFSFKYLRPIRYWHLGLALLLCLATVYCRYHYAIDVISGLVTAAVLIPLGNWLFRLTRQIAVASKPTANNGYRQVDPQSGN